MFSDFVNSTITFRYKLFAKNATIYNGDLPEKRVVAQKRARGDKADAHGVDVSPNRANRAVSCWRNASHISIIFLLGADRIFVLDRVPVHAIFVSPHSVNRDRRRKKIKEKKREKTTTTTTTTTSRRTHGRYRGYWSVFCRQEVCARARVVLRLFPACTVFVAFVRTNACRTEETFAFARRDPRNVRVTWIRTSYDVRVDRIRVRNVSRRRAPRRWAEEPSFDFHVWSSGQ